MMELEKFKELIYGMPDDFFSIYSVPKGSIERIKNNTLYFYRSVVEGGHDGLWFIGQNHGMAALYRAKVCADLIRMAGLKCQILQDIKAEEEYYVKIV